jgi:translation initiation factor 1 (eIF-1/SUI1)
LIQYCEYKGTLSECRKALLEADPELAALFSHEDAPLGPTKQPKPKKQVVQKVVIAIIERTKRKRVTIVTGLETFGD